MGATGALIAQYAGTAAAVASAASALDKPDIPEPKPPTPVPDPRAQAVARRRSIAEQLKRHGKESTFLTSERLGE